MKNDFCDLPQEAINDLPERFKGFLLSPFQFNRSDGFVQVPEDTFKEMVAIIAEYAQKDRAATAEKSLLIDCWHQFAIDVEIDGETWQSDGALSTLEDLADYLVGIGYLIRHPTKDVYRKKP